MRNATHTPVAAVYSMTDTRGTITAGWVGMAIFLVASIAFALWRRTRLVHTPEMAYRFSLMCFSLAGAYMLTAQEQFIIVRGDLVHINLLLMFVNAYMLLQTVVESGMQVSPPSTAHKRRAVWRMAILAQLFFIGGAVSWNSVRYGAYIFGMLLMLCTLAHFIYPVAVVDESVPVDRARLKWFIGAAILFGCYQLLMLLSHSFTGPLSLAGAVSAFIVVHVVSIAFLVYVHRILAPSANANTLLSAPPPSQPSSGGHPNGSGSSLQRSSSVIELASELDNAISE